MAAAGSVTDIRRRRICDALIARMAMTSGAPSWDGDECMTFAAGPLMEVLGIDPAARFRGRWRTKLGALRVLKQSGFSTVLEACEAIAADLGWPRIQPDDAEPGDPGLIEVAGVQACVLHHPSGLWVSRSMSGYACVPVNKVIAAWRCV